jgi:hypothetical protein
MPSARKREPVVPKRVRAAIAFMLEQKPDLQAAAAHAGMSTYESPSRDRKGARPQICPRRATDCFGGLLPRIAVGAGEGEGPI